MIREKLHWISKSLWPLYVIIIAVFGFGLLFIRPSGVGANIGFIMINIGPYMFLIALISFAIEIAYAALIVIAAIKSNKGIFHRYPLTIEFFK